MAEQSASSANKVSRPSAANNDLTLNIWEKKWADGEAEWQEDKGNKQLWRVFPQLIREKFPTRKIEDLKVFVPLCGKAKDMYLFYQMGLTVVGVEYTAQAIKEFFEENGMSNVNTDDAPYSKSSDGRLVLGQGDLYTFNGEQHKLPFPKYDIIWDRGSFVAVNENERTKYVEFMKKLEADNSLYLMNILEYSRTEYGGPPLTADKEELEDYFGRRAELLQSDDVLSEGHPLREMFIGHGMTKLTECLYAIRREQND